MERNIGSFESFVIKNAINFLRWNDSEKRSIPQRSSLLRWCQLIMMCTIFPRCSRTMGLDWTWNRPRTRSQFVIGARYSSMGLCFRKMSNVTVKKRLNWLEENVRDEWEMARRSIQKFYKLFSESARHFWILKMALYLKSNLRSIIMVDFWNFRIANLKFQNYKFKCLILRKTPYARTVDVE